MSDLTPRTATTRDVVSVNRTAILDALQHGGPLSRKQIASATGLGTATVDRLCAALIAERRIAVHGQQPSAGGRPTQLLRYDGTSHTVAALEVGARGARGRLVNLDGEIVDELISADSDAPLAPLDALIWVIDELRARADALESPCLAIGVSVPGVVHRGRVMNTTELGWHEIPLAAMLESRSGLPTIVENDANAIAFGEWSCGAGTGSQSLAALVVGVGVGAGVVTQGRLHHGANSAAGEVGFLLADTAAMSRYFTDQGDLEGRIESLAQSPSSPQSPGADDRSTAIANLIGRASAVPEQAGATGELFDLLAFSCAAISVIFDPETIVLSGHLALPDRIAIDQIERRLIGRIPFVPRFATGTLGADAAIVGVAELAARGARGATYLA